MPSIEWNRRWASELSEPVRPGDEDYYGQRWGDPEASAIRHVWNRLRGRRRGPGNLRTLARRFVRPNVAPDVVALEIGPGGGRWTSLLLGCREIILVDLNPEFFPYLRERFPEHLGKLRFYQTDGYELNGIDADSVDFVFSFGTFVHIEADGIASYLDEIHRVLRPGGKAVIQYSAKNKPRARQIRGFADMDATRMAELVVAAQLRVVVHDTSLLDHSNVIELAKE